ncbi:MAG: hypothetical protein QXU72_03240 [Thermofilum sp.]
MLARRRSQPARLITLPEELSESFYELDVRLEMSVEILLKAIHLLYLHFHDAWFLHSTCSSTLR